MDQYTPEERATSDAFRERIRRTPGVIFHESNQRIPFVPEIWVEGDVDIEDLLRYDDEEDEENSAEYHSRMTGS